MEINDIKPDTIYVMTAGMYSIFIAGGCDPTCHCCRSKIPVGSEYKLGSVTEHLVTMAKESSKCVFYPFSVDRPHEVMLCGKPGCTAAVMVENAIKRKEYRARTYTGGCSIVDGKIVP